MKLSKRLEAVASLVSNSQCVADVGTDHGYIPIYLVENQKTKTAIAMDINKGPLLRAKENIESHGFTEQIETRLSDGLKEVLPGECDAVVVAGMGGNLVIKILEEGKHIRQNVKEWILQPQSELWKVREYLVANEYCIVDEDIVEEDGKIYPMMKVVNGISESYQDIELQYGKCLLQKKHPTLLLYLDKEIRTKEQILKQLETENKAMERIHELRKELMQARAAFLKCL